MKILSEEQKEKARLRAKRWNDNNRERRLEAAKINYQKNKEKRLAYRKQYYQSHKDQCSKQMKLYWNENKDRLKLKNNGKARKRIKIEKKIIKKSKLDIKQYMKEYSKKYYAKNVEYLKNYKKEWQFRNRDRLNKKAKVYYIENKDRHVNYSKEWYQKNKYKIAMKAREKGSSGKKIPMELYLRMLNVRIRDNNTCQWYGCGLKHKVTEVHVHHIFPKSEYPELQLEEKYMICYCAEHHAQFHAARGDYYHKIIKDSRKLIPNADHQCNIFENMGDSD